MPTTTAILASSRGAGRQVRLLATFTSARLKRFPNVPTVKELGHDFVIESPVGLVAPRGLDPKIAARLQGVFMKSANDPEYLKQLDNFDMQENVMSGAGYVGYAKGQFERERRMLGERGFKAEGSLKRRRTSYEKRTSSFSDRRFSSSI